MAETSDSNIAVINNFDQILESEGTAPDKKKMQFRTREDFIENGRALFQKHCGDRDLPLFFPDESSNEKFPLLSDFQQREKDDIDNESNNLSKIHKILASFKGPVLVLCGLKYNHCQFHLWDPDFDAMAGAKRETIPNCSIEHGSKIVGSNDFILFGPDYAVLIEVHPSVVSAESKASPNQKRRLSEKLSNQRTLIEFIRKIASAKESKTEGVSEFKVFRYIAFPLTNNISRISFSKAYGENFGVIKKNDLNYFAHWWADNITSSAPGHCEIVTGN